MNKYLSILACAAGLISFASCSESEVNEVIDNNPQLITFKVGAPSAGTRAVIAGDVNAQNVKVDWETTDKINVWGLNGSTTPTVFNQPEIDAEYQNYAKFEGIIAKASKYFVMYPDQAGATISFSGEKGNISATVPSVQKATANSFDPAAAICAGATKSDFDNTVEVLHACAFLKITTTKPCYSVTVTPATNKSYSMTGGVTIEASSSGSKIIGFPSGVPSVTLTADGTANCASTFPAGTYLMAIIPSTEYPGLDIMVDYGGDDKPHVTNETQLQLNAANIYNLGTAQ